MPWAMTGCGSVGSAPTTRKARRPISRSASKQVPWRNSPVPFPTPSSAGSGASRFTCKQPSYPALAVARAAVVIPSWNGAHFLGECLASLISQTESAELVLVDNGSTDGTDELVRERFAGVTLLKLAANHGFAGAVNIGVAHAVQAGVKYVALFNNDAVAEPDWLERLIACAEAHPEAGIVTSKFLLSDWVHIDSTGDFYSSWGWAYPRGRDEVDRGQYDAPEVREVFCGS